MKRFDFAAEVIKQTITIASAIITVLIAFYEKFFSHISIVFYLVMGDLLCFAASIVFGVFCLGGIVNLAERQEYNDIENGSSSKLKQSSKTTFVRLGGTPVVTLAICQQLLFFGAFIAFITIAVLDKAEVFGVHPASVDSSSASKATGVGSAGSQPPLAGPIAVPHVPPAGQTPQAGSAGAPNIPPAKQVPRGSSITPQTGVQSPPPASSTKP